MKITSLAFESKQIIPPKYTCDGEDVNPPLQISDIPDKTQSLALIVDDPDAPGGDWVHWLLWNINPKTKLIIENKSPKEAVQGINDFNKQSYGGPCPPSGIHHYQFKIYALDTILNLPSSSRKKDLETAMINHILDKDILIGLYQRI
jgi:Raf kinase inhibitor-like YbhB/YbcL family protein